MVISIPLALAFAAVAAAQSLPGYGEEAASGQPAANDGLPAWVVRDATGTFTVPAAEPQNEPPQEAAAPASQDDLPQSEPPQEAAAPASQDDSPQSEPPQTLETPARTTGGDARRSPAPIEAAPWRPQTPPEGLNTRDLSESFLSAMANTQPLAKRPVATARGDGGNLAERAAYERTLEKRIDELLAVTLGPDAARAFVRVYVEAISGSTKPVLEQKREQGGALWDEIQERLDAAPPVLPGYKLPRSLRAEALSLTAAAAAPTASPERTRSVLTVSLLVDHGVNERDLTPVTAAVADAIGLDPDRGDILQVSRASLKPGWKRILSGASVKTAMVIILFAACAAAVPFAAAALFGYGNGFSRRRERRAKSIVSSVAPRADYDPVPFWSDARYTQAIADFLSTQPAQSAAAVMGLLTPDAAGAVFRRLPEASRRRIAAMLSAGDKVGAKELFAAGQLRQRLREHLASYARGPGLLEELLVRAPERIRSGLIGDLRRLEPQRAARLERSLPSLRALANADEASLRLCLSAFETADLVCAFYDFDEAAREKMLDCLPLLLREAIREKLKTFVPDSTDSVEDARAKITARWRRLDLDGRVTSFLAASADAS